MALFYDWLNQWGGAERVLLDLIKLYPDAPIYTLVHNPKKTKWLPKNKLIIPSFINQLPFSKTNPFLFTPLYDIALEQFDFSAYDIVISTTSTVGHCLITPPKTLFVCYLHNINRYLYQLKPKYFFMKPLISLYRTIDKIYSKRPDALICNSQTVQTRILQDYLLDAQIINPGINLNKFKPSPTPTRQRANAPYFLVVSRLVPHKNIDIVINAFKKLPYQLKIVGTGRHLTYLKELSNNQSNIEFLGSVSTKTLINLYQNAQALICPQLEDFGLTAIESQACGTPVIGLGRGGNTETIVNHKTGIYFNNPSSKSLILAIKKFNKSSFSSLECRQNATRFSRSSFMLNFKKSIELLWQKHQTIMS